MHSALAFGRGNALDPMHSALKLQGPVDLTAPHLHTGFLNAPNRAVGHAQHLHGPAFFVAVAQVGTQKFTGK